MCPPANLPPALENEGAFAASGTNIAVFGKISRVDRNRRGCESLACCAPPIVAARGKLPNTAWPLDHPPESSRSLFAMRSMELSLVVIIKRSRRLSTISR